MSHRDISEVWYLIFYISSFLAFMTISKEVESTAKKLNKSTVKSYVRNVAMLWKKLVEKGDKHEVIS